MKSKNISQLVFCSVAALCAVILSVTLLLSYRVLSAELNSLAGQAAEATDSWKRINDDKLEVKKTLRELENRITDAEDLISSAEKREKDISRLREDIASLTEQIDILDK